MSHVKIGMIGYNEGNGHPYSFSAIINGYNPKEMKKSPYPIIYDYLSTRSKNEFGVGDLQVTHVWAPDISIAKNIASCANIANVVNDYQEMVNDVDAVIIARDDPESHKIISKYFLDYGKPVFIDKPLCDNLDDLSFFEPWLQNGLLMSCSGFRYYPSITSNIDGKLKMGNIIFSHNIGINSWSRYGIHLLEGITPIMGNNIQWVQNYGEENNDIIRVQYENGKFALFQINNDLGFILRSSFYTNGNIHYTINYDDNFSCFKNLLIAFHEQIRTGEPSIPPNETIYIIKTIIAGINSKKNNCKRVYINDLKLIGNVE